MQSLVLEQCDAFALSQRKRCQCNAYRAPGSPIAAFGVESVIDELAAELDIDPIEFEPFSLAELASKAALTGGPIAVQTSVNAQGPGPAFATHICDVEVDEETGRVDITRYTAVQDAGRAIHPDYVEGQMQGGVAQGIGWALNEEYIYDEDGHLENPGFLDYRIPVASDLPMIDTIVVEVPNDAHPHGVRGAGEVPIVPPMAAVANAIHDATGLRLGELPMSPPKVLAALAAKAETRTPLSHRWRIRLPDWRIRTSHLKPVRAHRFRISRAVKSATSLRSTALRPSIRRSLRIVCPGARAY